MWKHEFSDIGILVYCTIEYSGYFLRGFKGDQITVPKACY